MSQFKILHQKKKSFLREIIQNFFLKVLVVIFKKDSLLYKDKIKDLFNTTVGYISFGIKILFIRLKYPFKLNVPNRHIFLLYSLNKFIKILKPKKINFFLLGGTLLGAIRQESFADTRDLDLGIKENEFTKLLDALPLLIKSGAVGVRANSENQNQQRLQILYPFLLIDVVVYKKEKVEKEYLWIGEKDDKKSKYLGFEFPEADLENLVRVKAYGQEFLSPANPEIYLEKVYGKNWKVPKFNSSMNKKNFFQYKK